jgi:asparagine synthase (glutamine-hydrolysing)
MCGLAGVVSREPIEPPQVELVRNLSALLRHRGPDGAGEFIGSHVALAMRRLSIIDLSTGWQPLHNEDKSLALVANGEIYNFVELREQLESRGHCFATHSDCETILHLYEDHGDHCVQHLRGMYAFALWDLRRQRLLLARDRMGEKPLYLVRTERQIVFASELKSLLRAGVIPLDLDPEAVHLYYHYGYVPEPMTIVRGVRKLPAGHVLSVDVERWVSEECCYWRMEDAQPLDGDPATLLREELERISEFIVRSDVPIGVALSGGMDSSAIAILASKKYRGTMCAFTVGFVGRPRQDERDDARQLADYLRMPFHEIELATEDVVRDYGDMVYCRDDPIADISGPNYFAVMKLARSHGVPVVLMGQGGDELFWGYRWVRAAVDASRRKQALHDSESVGLGNYLTLTVPPYSYTAGVRWLRSIGGLLSGWRQFQLDRTTSPDRLVFYDLEPGWQAAAAGVHRIYSPSFCLRTQVADPAALFTVARPWSPINVVITRLICQSYLLGNGIAQGDRLGMASSVELRLPLVDYRLVEMVIGLQKARMDSHVQPKRWLHDALKDSLPAFVVKRRKRGFAPPWRQWVAGLATAYGSWLEDGWLVQQAVLDPAAAKRMRGNLSPPPWGSPSILAQYSLSLEMWCRQMSGAIVEPAP